MRMIDDTPGALAGRFHAARRDPDLAVLEGLHALKHAHRFGAALLEVVVSDGAATDLLATDLAPDVLPILERAVRVAPGVFAQLAPVPHATGVIALARRPQVDVAGVLAGKSGAVVLLERPTHAGNLGASVRVAAGAGAAAVITLGGEDPWSPPALRGGAGLQFALPVARIDDGSGTALLAGRARPLVAVHPEGEPLERNGLPLDAIYAFGSERTGLSESLLAQATRSVRIPMRAGVSSLNLSTAVAVILYSGITDTRA